MVKLSMYLYLSGVLLVSSCVGVSNSVNKQLTQNNCNQQNIYAYEEDDLPTPIFILDVDSTLWDHFSFKSLNVANAIGALDYLQEYVNQKREYGENPSIENRVSLLELSNRITQRINSSSLEISAVASEIDCEEERADQIASYMKRKDDDAETISTVGAIIVGAAGAISTGVLLANNTGGKAAEMIGIGTGLAEAIFGLSILTYKQKVDFYHKRNALRQLWEGRATSSIFPTSVWYYLNYYDPYQPEFPSLRYQILEQWMSFGQISIAKSKKKRDLIGIYFSDGGRYSSEQLYTRANMLDQLESNITLMKQDLKGLALELEYLKTNKK